VSNADGSGVKSAERALSILELFSQRDRALTFTQVAQMLGYPRSSLHGLLHTMADRGWLRLDPATRRFTLGMRAWEAGNAYRPAADVARRAAPVVERLRHALDATVEVCMLDGGDAVCVIDGNGEQRTAALASGSGRVLLAALDAGARAAVLNGAGDGELQRRLDRIAADGWADDDIERRDGLRSLAVPVRDGSGAVVAALSCTAPAYRLAAERRDEALRALRQAAEQIGAGLGLQPVG